MHPVASRCIFWGVVLFIAGAIGMKYIPNVYSALEDVAGPNAEIGLGIADVTLTAIRLGLMPMAASLIGAGIVIQTLSGQTREGSPTDEADSRAS